MNDNRLGSAVSPYLRQHADNPVDWREWGPEAFAEARERDVPVLVSVGYATDVRHAQDVIKEVADTGADDPELGASVLEPPEVWGVEDLGADGVTIHLVIKTAPSQQWKVMRELRLRLKERLDAEGIEIPFPQQVTWVRRADGSGDLPGAPDEPDDATNDATNDAPRPKGAATRRGRLKSEARQKGEPSP